MGEHTGAAVLALALALIGFVLIIAGIRGTYGDVWQAAKSPLARAGANAASAAASANQAAGIGG